MIGKHYLVGANDKKRQYTICNCMEKESYKMYLKAMKTLTISSASKHFNENPTSKFSLTIKDY